MVNKPKTLRKIELKIKNQSSFLKVCLIDTKGKGAYFEQGEKQARHQSRFQRDGTGSVPHRASLWCGSSREARFLD